ncbi:DUF5996 family protein [Algoriphagus namhaensis]
MAGNGLQWPVLNFQESESTFELLHHWTQIVGKVRLKLSPKKNHSWHVTLYLDPAGLTTGPIPYGSGIFEIKFDFNRHELKIKTSSGRQDRFALAGQTVASFYEQLLEKLEYLGVKVKIHGSPNELPEAVPFAKNKKRLLYQPEAAKSFWKALICIKRTLLEFGEQFAGKCSPIHFFWGSFDLAYTRFSGRKAPKFSGSIPNMPSHVMEEAYSHELYSVGFWPGNKDFPEPSFYAYCYPNLPEFKEEPVQPKEAYWNEALGEFMLSYAAVQKSPDGHKKLLEFCNSTYHAAAKVANWDRDALETDFN